MPTPIEVIDESLKKLRDDRSCPIPTPNKGFEVLYYPRGIVELNHAEIAWAHTQEAPGQLTLCVMTSGGRIAIKRGVKYCADPAIKDQPHNPGRVHSGLWGYMEHQQPLKCHLSFHTNQLLKREEDLLNQKRMEMQAAINKADRPPAQEPPKAAE